VFIHAPVSVGGALTHFAAPPVVMVAAKWGWGLKEVFAHFGVAALVSILLSNLTYLIWFRREFATLKGAAEKGADEPSIPAWVVVFHLACMVWTVLMLTEHRPVLMLGGFLVFLAFTTATSRWQPAPGLRGPALVGFFLAGLVVLGGVQGWWISPVLGRMGEGALLAVSTFLTAFNDNAAVTYLASQVPAFSLAGPEAEALRHAVLAGALAGGGLTVIANAPNPAGQSILSPWFSGGVSAWRLFLWAAMPTCLALGCFIWLK
jgi:Na+/H+ antiporter NhaD/arsenite permease-like protein